MKPVLPIYYYWITGLEGYKAQTCFTWNGRKLGKRFGWTRTASWPSTLWLSDVRHRERLGFFCGCSFRGRAADPDYLSMFWRVHFASPMKTLQWSHQSAAISHPVPGLEDFHLPCLEKNTFSEHVWDPMDRQLGVRDENCNLSITMNSQALVQFVGSLVARISTVKRTSLCNL